jgi:hypothetical protein
VVALEQDVGRSTFLTENQAVRSVSRIGSFSLFALAGGGTELIAIGAQHWRISLPQAAPGWVSLPVAYSPLWVARADGAPLALRRGERGLVEVALAASASSVELEHRAGGAERAGVALSLGSVLLLAVWWRRAPRG